MRKRMLMTVGLLLCAGCLQGCTITHTGTGKYVAKIEFGYEVDEHKNDGKAVSDYDTMNLSRAFRYLFTGKGVELPPAPVTP